MIRGVHLLLFSKDPPADRAFLRDVLGFPGIDIHDGWMIFAAPPAELAVHPRDDNHLDDGGVLGASLWLMSDDLEGEVARLTAAGVEVGPIADEPWGRRTTIALPSGGRLGLYEPRHQTMVGMERPAGGATPPRPGATVVGSTRPTSRPPQTPPAPSSSSGPSPAPPRAGSACTRAGDPR